MPLKIILTVVLMVSMVCGMYAAAKEEKALWIFGLMLGGVFGALLDLILYAIWH